MAAKSLFRPRSPAAILPVCFRTNSAILFPPACHTIFGRAKIKQETQQPNMRRIAPSRRNAYSRTQCTRRMPGRRRPKLYCNTFPTGQGGANVPGFNATSPGRAQLFSLGITKALSPNTLNEFHLSYMRFANNVGQPVGGVGPKLSAQGFVEGAGTLGIVPLDPKIEGIENVSFNNYTFGVDTTGETQVNNTYQGTDNFSKVIGKHSLKVGGGLHFDQVNVNPDAVFNGSFQFEGTETGSDFADFLL